MPEVHGAYITGCHMSNVQERYEFSETISKEDEYKCTHYDQGKYGHKANASK